MFIVSELLQSLAYLCNMLFQVIYWLLIIRIVLSWFGVHPDTTYNELLNVLYRITDPILAPFRRLSLQVGMMDFSPIVAFVAVDFLRRLIVNILLNAAARVG